MLLFLDNKCARDCTPMSPNWLHISLRVQRAAHSARASPNCFMLLAENRPHMPRCKCCRLDTFWSTFTKPSRSSSTVLPHTFSSFKREHVARPLSTSFKSCPPNSHPNRSSTRSFGLMVSTFFSSILAANPNSDRLLSESVSSSRLMHCADTRLLQTSSRLSPKEQQLRLSTRRRAHFGNSFSVFKQLPFKLITSRCTDLSSSAMLTVWCVNVFG
mmetsp:Transcript_65/g.108  ORF Transcript_65/g.108 Transcript_65/m.108 type:complete len:215 (+) Transcript_65:634-1278(+)